MPAKKRRLDEQHKSPSKRRRLNNRDTTIANHDSTSTDKTKDAHSDGNLSMLERLKDKVLDNFICSVAGCGTAVYAVLSPAFIKAAGIIGTGIIGAVALYLYFNHERMNELNSKIKAIQTKLDRKQKSLTKKESEIQNLENIQKG